MDVVLTAGPKAHSYYQEILGAPPEGVRYVQKPLDWNAPLTGDAAKDRATWRVRGAKRKVFGEPEIVSVPDWGAPIHSAQNLLRSARPWVMDFEYPTALTSFDPKRLTRWTSRRRVARAVRNGCGAIMPWTQAAADATARMLPEVADKVKVVRPGVTPRERSRPEDPDAPLVIFVARFFERKGGLEALEAFARARRAHNPRARMLMISAVPPEIQERYQNEGVAFEAANQPREQVLQKYRQASLFLMPTWFDTFGMVFLEAFAHGLPVVTSDTFGADEIVEHGRDGLVVPGYATRWFLEDHTPNGELWQWEKLAPTQTPEERERVVKRLADALGPLLADPKKLEKMGDRAHAKVTEGAFSTRERNRRLLDVYRASFA